MENNEEIDPYIKASRHVFEQRKRAAGGGRKAKGGRMIKLRTSADVQAILDAQEDTTAYIEAAVREKYQRESKP